MENDGRPCFQLEMSPSEFELEMTPNVRILNKIERAGRLFSYLRFSEIGAPPGTTEKILSKPEKYWRKKIDGNRVFFEPMGPLRKIHDKIGQFLGNHGGAYHANFPATAFWKGSSVIQNGLYHRKNSSSFVLDAKNAFESIKAKHIYRYLLRTGTMLYGPHDLYFSDRAQAWIISRLLTYRGLLRQGSPASPFVFNLLCARLDMAMQKKLEPFPDVVYTRYADDFCFSAGAPVFPQQVERTIREVLREHHIVLNEKKTRRSGNGILDFPGIVIVRGKIRPPGEYVSRLAQGYMSFKEWLGHTSFLHQFGRGGVPKTLKAQNLLTRVTER